MRSKPLIILGSFVVAAVLLIVACEGAGKESPLQIQAPDVTLDEQRIPADGVSSVEVTVTVLTADNKKVENVPINLIARSAADTSEDLGTLSQSVVFTDATGEATATLTSIESSRDTSAIIFASMGDTTGINLTINPKTGATFSAVPAPPGAVAILSSRPLDDDELEARLHAVLLQRAQENAAERRKGLSAILGDPVAGEGSGILAFNATQQTVIFEGIVITLTSNKTQLPADGVSTATMEARVRTTRGINVQNMPLIFAAREGKITPTGLTDQFGSATATLTAAITDSTEDVIVVRMGYTLTDTLLVPYVQPVLTIIADDVNIAADGSSTTTIRARLLTPGGNPVAGASVAFTLTGPNDASITVQGTTSSTGEATAILKTGGTAGNATITASFSSLTASTTVQLLGLNVTLTPAKTSILANGTATTTITLLAKTQTTNVAVVGKEVVFAVDLGGKIPQTATTNSSGVATVTLVSSTTPGNATVTAVIGSVTITTTVTFTATANISVELSSAADRLLRDGQDETTITASVVDGEGKALSGRVVTFALTGQGALSTSQPQQTGTGGTASVDLIADAATTDGNAQIIATSEGESDTLDVPLRGVTLILTSSPAAIVANGTNEATLTLLVKETTTNAGVAGRSVQFASTRGTIPATATTDASGVASVDLRSGETQGTATVTATLGTLSTSKDVVFLPESLSLNISALKGAILRDGEDYVELTVYVQDPNGNSLDNLNVNWSITGTDSAYVFPEVGQTGVESATGTHKTKLYADVGVLDATASITATVADSTISMDIWLEGITVIASMSADTILANGLTNATFTAQAYKTSSNVFISNHELLVRKISGPDVGITVPSYFTNSSGIVTATINSKHSSGDLIMEGVLAGISEQDTLHLEQDQLSVSLTHEDDNDDGVLLRDGDESTVITARVTDKDGDAVPNQRVDFELVSGSGELEKPFDVTDSNGEATVDFQADVSSGSVDAIIKASVSTAADTLTIPLFGVIITISTDPDSLVADGKTEVIVSATVQVDETNNPLSNRRVYFSVGPGTFGSIDGFGDSDSKGIASATLTGISTTDFTATVYSRLGSNPSTTLVDSTTLSVLAPKRRVSLSSADEELLRNNLDYTTLTALVRDNNLEPLSDASVEWALIGGTPSGVALSGSITRTDNEGLTTVRLTGDASGIDATATIQATVGDSSNTYSVALNGVVLSLDATRLEITANKVDTTWVEATLKEYTANRGVAGETIRFSSTLGTIQGSAVTDDNGKAKVLLTAGDTLGVALVMAYNGPLSSGIQDTVSVAFSTAVAATIELSSPPVHLQPLGTGGISTAPITARVLDINNQPVPSRIQVEFQLFPSVAGTFEGGAQIDTVTTNDSGLAVINFQSGTVATPVTITARVLGTSVESSNAILTVSAGPVAHVSIAVTPISWNDDGYYERELHGTVTDTFSNAIKDQIIVWTGEPDSLKNAVVAYLQEESTTDETGVAHSLLVYKRGEETTSFTLYATAENVQESRVLGGGSITITSTPTTLLRDGLDTASLSATLGDMFGTKVGLVFINWSNPSGIGTLAYSATFTDLNGDPDGSNIYQSDARTTDTTVTIQASYGATITRDATFNLTGVSLDISASPDTLSANGMANSTISARFFETTTQRSLAGYELEFSAKSGSITGSPTTGSDGVASVLYNASSTTGIDTIIATRGGIADTTYIELVNSSSAWIELESSETNLAVLATGGTEMALITTTVWDDNGYLVPAGTAVQMVASTGTFSNGTDTITHLTDTNGQATFVYQSGATAGTVTFTATSGTATGSAPLLTISFGPATQILLGNSTTVTDLDNGFSTITIAALVSDVSGDAVAEGTQVFFEVTVGGAISSIEPYALTDETGLAEVTLTFLTAQSGVGNVTIQASIGAVTQTLAINPLP